MFNLPPFFTVDLPIILGKISFLVVTALTTIFLLVVLRQVLQMNSLVNDLNDAIILKLVSFILLMSSLSLFFVALVIL